MEISSLNEKSRLACAVQLEAPDHWGCLQTVNDRLTARSVHLSPAYAQLRTCRAPPHRVPWHRPGFRLIGSNSYMTEFFELRFEIAAYAPDSAVRALEEMAEACAPGRWQCQFDGDWTCFRFQLKHDALKFFLACSYRTRSRGMEQAEGDELRKSRRKINLRPPLGPLPTFTRPARYIRLGKFS